jgi:hypothetical protein
MDGRRARGEIWAYPMRGGDAHTAMLFSYLSCEARISAGSTAPADRGDCEALWVLLPEFEKLKRNTDSGRLRYRNCFERRFRCSPTRNAAGYKTYSLP